MGIIEQLWVALMSPVHVIAGLLSLGTFGFAVGCAQVTLGRHSLSAKAHEVTEIRSTLVTRRHVATAAPALWRQHLNRAGNIGVRVEVRHERDASQPEQVAASARVMRLFTDLAAA